MKSKKSPIKKISKGSQSNNKKSNDKKSISTSNKGFGKSTGTAVPFPFNLLRF